MTATDDELLDEAERQWHRLVEARPDLTAAVDLQRVLVTREPARLIRPAIAKALAEKARAGQLKLEEVSGGTFTVSNLGMFGVDQFTAIINPPEAAILAVGQIKKQPVVVEDEVVIRAMMSVTLSSDHRLVDGALAARFLARFKSILEEPLELLISP